MSKPIRENVRDKKNFTNMNVFDDQLFDVVTITDTIIKVPESKLKLHLTNHIRKLEKKNSWTTPAGIGSGFLISLVTGNFESTEFLKYVKSSFYIVVIICFLWLCYTLQYIHKSVTVDDIVIELKKDQRNFEK
jgi:hypothetical protein